MSRKSVVYYLPSARGILEVKRLINGESSLDVDSGSDEVLLT